jgi:hypothetical protein
MRKPLFTVKISDCEVQTFRSGGKGGQNQNKRDTGVRIIHHPSGARGESRDQRTQGMNKRTAFVRMARTPEFQTWAKLTGLRVRPIDELVDEAMAEKNLKLEVREGGRWVESNTLNLPNSST